MRSLGRWARDSLDASLIALWLGLLVRTFLVQAYQVPSTSMEPLLQQGDYVLVNKLLVKGRGTRNPWLPQRPTARGDVLVFPHPQEAGRLLIKRCLAGAGTHVELRDKALYLHREKVQEPYVQHLDDRVYPSSTFLPSDYRVRDQFGPIVVSPNDLFCMGDNRDHSLDSRHWGTVEKHRTVGQAVLALRLPAKSKPLNQAGASLNPERDARPPKNPPGQRWRVFRIR